MKGTKKIIAVCTTKVQSQDRVSFIEGLYNKLDKNSYKIMVFSSPSDFFTQTPGDIGAKATFDIINYEKIDCLVIDKMHFKSDDVFNSIVGKAKEHAVPVIVYNAEIDGCYCIIADYENSYRELISHLIDSHSYKDFFFIGGIKGEAESEKRLSIFKDVLAQRGISLTDDNVAYGQYYEAPVFDIFDDLYYNCHLPEVFVCANDAMAFAIYQKAQEYGLRIPEDIAVVGFDGLSYSPYLTPPLATCTMDETKLISITEDVIAKVCDGSIDPQVFYNTYNTSIGGSCGCKCSCSTISNKVIMSTFRGYEKASFYEDHIFNTIEKAIDFDCRNNIYEVLIQCSVPNSHICIKKDFSSAMNDLSGHDKGFSDKFFVLTSEDNMEELKSSQKIFPFSDMVPYYDEWENDDTLYLVTAIYAGDSICGHYAIKTSRIQETAHRFNRTGRAINTIMTEALTRYKQRNISHESAKALNIDTSSGLPNLKGLCLWFNEFSSHKENHQKTVMVSLYWLPKYKEFYEKYGLEELDQIVSYISETLKIASPHNSFISQIAEDEFVVINYVDDSKDVATTINNATNVFFGLRDNFEQEKKQKYGNTFEMEVNCGCTVVDKDWSDTIKIIELVKLARAEMFVNRFKYGGSNNQKTARTAREDYNALMLLISRNRFIYHYQPIIDVKSKNIYAYEALMRTDTEINMSPLDVLATADSYHRLYDIERATFFNVMEQYSKEQADKFKYRKVFINSIPGYFLDQRDREEIREKYSSLFDYFVFEITESGDASDEEVSLIKTLGNNEFGIPIAIDDYGSGCSNIVNLLRYAPQIIKVDRFLITDIDKDTNKQMFMKGTIEFASASNIKVLAEGVETQEEFKTVVSLGVDYVQGYYTGRPSKEPMSEIPEFVVNDIQSV